jgi:hypothetical protein
VLQKGQGDHGQHRMMVQPLPGAALKVIETEFFFQLLVALFTTPPRFDGGDEGWCRRLGRMVGKVKFALPCCPPLPDQPDHFARQVLPRGEFGAIRDSDPDDCEPRLPFALRAAPPFHCPPVGPW